MTIRFSSRCLAWLIASSLMLGAVPGRAEPSSADLDTARRLYVEGLELRDAGKLDGSLARFKAAHALAATPITSLELARAYMLLSQSVLARDVLVSIERMPVLPSESAKAASARAEARTMLERIRERMPALRVVFAGEPTAPPLLTIDGTVFPSDGTSFHKVDAGRHVLVAKSADGARASAEVLLTEGESRTVTLTLSDASMPSPQRDSSTPRSSWFYVGVGTAGLGLVAGTVAGAIAVTKADSLESQCTGNVCPRSAEDDLSTSRSMGTISTIAFAVAGAGLIMTVVSLLSPSTSKGPPRSAGWQVGTW